MNSCTLRQSADFTVGPDVTVEVLLPDGRRHEKKHPIRHRRFLAELVGLTAVEAGHIKCPTEIRMDCFTVKRWNRATRVAVVELSTPTEQ